jgi:asparagine synthase (glutamine-hydrolysing)
VRDRGVISKSEIKPAIVRAMTEVFVTEGLMMKGIFLLTIRESCHRWRSGHSSAVWSAGLNFSPGTRIDRLVSSYQIILGHRRLSILDLSPTGHQPFSYSDGRYWICFNGMIYNHKEIREELRSLGHDFISGTDTEVIVAAYAEWGTGCLNKFAGMWAFAIYDHFSGSLCLARDRYGIKPLYYWFSDEETFSRK